MNLLASILFLFAPSKTTFYGVPLNHSVTFKNEIQMSLTGFGVATKKVGVTTARIAVFQFFTERPTQLNRTEAGALASLPRVGNMVMNITFLRSVDSESVKNQIDSVISDNIPDPEFASYERDIAFVREAILTDDYFSGGSSITVYADTRKGVLVYENAKGVPSEIVPVNRDFVYRVFSAWFGKTSDSSSYNLKMQLLAQPSIGG